MAKFVLSAFADEYSPVIDKQIEGLKANGIGMLEIRGVDGTNIAHITEEKAREVKAKFDANGIKVSCIGSPIGKIKITDPFEPHLEELRHVIKLAKIFETKKIRMFSFYPDHGEPMSEMRDEVMKRLAAMLEIAEAEDVLLCHENERGIYGDSVERCLDIQKEFAAESSAYSTRQTSSAWVMSRIPTVTTRSRITFSTSTSRTLTAKHA